MVTTLRPRLVGARHDTDGLRIHALVPSQWRPRAPTLVLVHGVGVSSRNVRPTAEALLPRVNVVAPDLPDHGLSTGPRQRLDIPGLADALAAWIDAAGLPRTAALGNSVGCQIVAELAARHPRLVSRIILQGPTIDPRARNIVRQVGRWLRNGLMEPTTQQSVTWRDWRDAGLRTLLGTARHAMRHHIEDVLPRVTVPALVVRGSRDPIAPQRWAEDVATLLPAGRLVVVPGGTHTLVARYPEELAEVVLPFLEEP